MGSSFGNRELLAEAFPAGRGDSPARRGDSPSERGDSPGGHGGSPAGCGDSPAGCGDSPGERGEAPGEREGVLAGNEGYVPDKSRAAPGGVGGALLVGEVSRYSEGVAKAGVVALETR
ncbi:hypothetical protein GCM10028824_09800 [Hymenobacter segetis]